MLKLWSIVYIVFDRFRPDSIQAFINRSGSHPLEIIIDSQEEAPQKSWQDTSMAFKDILKEIVPHVERWNAFELYVPRAHCQIMVDILAVLEPLNAPRLRKFSYKPRRSDTCSTHGRLQLGIMARLPFKGDLSRLQAFCFRYSTMKDDSPFYRSCVFRDLRTLDLDMTRMRHTFLLDVIASCPNLVTFRVNTMYDPTRTGRVQVEAPNLRSLGLVTVTTYTDEILEYIVAPKLRSLTLCVNERPFTRLANILSRPQETTGRSHLHSLTALWLRSCDGLLNATQVYQELGSLRVLTLDARIVAFVQLDMFNPVTMVVSVTNNPLLCQFASTYCSCCSEQTRQGHVPAPCLTPLIVMTEGAGICMLRELMIARREAGAPLHKLFLNSMAISDEDYDWFCKNLDAFGEIPQNWEGRPEMSYIEECMAIEAEPAGTREFENLCLRLGWKLYQPSSGISR